MNLDLDSILELSPPLLLMAALNVVGWVAKQSALPNRFVPVLLIVLGAAVWPILYDHGDMIINVRHQLATAILQGLCIGGAAVGVHQASRVFSKDQPASTPTLSPPPAPPKT